MPSTESAASVDEGAAAYGDELRTFGSGAFDVVMLGVGPDGHIASLFPGFPQLDVDDQIAVPVTGSPKPPPERISLTFAALNRSKSVWFLVSGEEKAGAVARALAEGTDVHDIPAAGVTGSEETIWFLDRAAASQPLTLGLAEVTGQPVTLHFYRKLRCRSAKVPGEAVAPLGSGDSSVGDR